MPSGTNVSVPASGTSVPPWKGEGAELGETYSVTGRDGAASRIHTVACPFARDFPNAAMRGTLPDDPALPA
jgi:hypothetical protein